MRKLYEEIDPTATKTDREQLINQCMLDQGMTRAETNAELRKNGFAEMEDEPEEDTTDGLLSDFNRIKKTLAKNYNCTNFEDDQELADAMCDTMGKAYLCSFDCGLKSYILFVADGDYSITQMTADNYETICTASYATGLLQDIIKTNAFKPNTTGSYTKPKMTVGEATKILNKHGYQLLNEFGPTILKLHPELKNQQVADIKLKFENFVHTAIRQYKENFSHNKEPDFNAIGNAIYADFRTLVNNDKMTDDDLDKISKNDMVIDAVDEGASYAEMETPKAGCFAVWACGMILKKLNGGTLSSEYENILKHAISSSGYMKRNYDSFEYELQSYKRHMEH